MGFFDCLRPRRRRSLPLTAPPPPHYRTVNRSDCPLLRLCWDQDWDEVLLRCSTHPEEAFCRTANTGRTALHLGTMPAASCPETVLLTLLETNPHAVLVSDHHKYGGTPLAFLCGSIHRRNPVILQSFVDAALRQERLFPECTPPVYSWSPLFLAAKWAAPARTLQILLATRQQQPPWRRWIAPWTGAEPGRVPRRRDSPLHALWTKQAELLDTNTLAPVTLQRMRHIAAAIVDDRQRLPDVDANLEPAVEAWMQCVLLLREHTTVTLVHTVVKIYPPIPGLVTLITKVDPEALLQRDDLLGRLPLHAALVDGVNDASKDNNEVMTILIQAGPNALMVVDGMNGLYPVLLAATHDAPLGTIYELLVTDPLVLQLQRQEWTNQQSRTGV